MAKVFVGTAGWAIPRTVASAFPAVGSGLVRYASVFSACEINSTFYRMPRQATFERWRDSVPSDFRFSVKVPKQISHETGLVGADNAFAAFAEAVSVLGDRLGPLLLQLPPTLAFDADTVAGFLEKARSATDAQLVVEPRHSSWFTDAADQLLAGFGVMRAGADPERAPGGLEPGGAPHLRYIRLHGSPRIYFSSYGREMIEAQVRHASASHVATWCIFDNTASGAAAANALQMLELLRTQRVG